MDMEMEEWKGPEWNGKVNWRGLATPYRRRSCSGSSSAGSRSLDRAARGHCSSPAGRSSRRLAVRLHRDEQGVERQTNLRVRSPPGDQHLLQAAAAFDANGLGQSTRTSTPSRGKAFGRSAPKPSGRRASAGVAASPPGYLPSPGGEATQAGSQPIGPPPRTTGSSAAVRAAPRECRRSGPALALMPAGMRGAQERAPPATTMARGRGAARCRHRRGDPPPPQGRERRGRLPAPRVDAQQAGVALDRCRCGSIGLIIAAHPLHHLGRSRASAR